MANKHRAEVEREIGGKTYSFRLSFSALMHVEGDVGKPFLAWATEDLAEGKLALKDLFSIFWRALKAGGHDISKEEAEELLDNLNLSEATELITDLVSTAFPQSEGDDEPEGE